jgi:hypothetical protein
VLYKSGFDSSEVQVLSYRPIKPIPLKTKAHIIINVPVKAENQRTTGGAQGQIDAEVECELDILWVANFTPLGTNPATYDNQADSDSDFNALVASVEEAIRLSTYFYPAISSPPTAKNWKLVDTNTGQQGTVKGREPNLRTYVIDAEAAENNNDLYYSALIKASYRLQYTASRH